MYKAVIGVKLESEKMISVTCFYDTGLVAELGLMPTHARNLPPHNSVTVNPFYRKFNTVGQDQFCTILIQVRDELKRRQRKRHIVWVVRMVVDSREAVRNGRRQLLRSPAVA